MKKTLYIITLLFFTVSCGANIDESKKDSNSQSTFTEGEENYFPAEVAAPNEFPETVGGGLEGGTFN